MSLQAQQDASGWYEMQDLLAVPPEWLPEIAPHIYHFRVKKPVQPG